MKPYRLRSSACRREKGYPGLDLYANYCRSYKGYDGLHGTHEILANSNLNSCLLYERGCERADMLLRGHCAKSSNEEFADDFLVSYNSSSRYLQPAMVLTKISFSVHALDKFTIPRSLQRGNQLAIHTRVEIAFLELAASSVARNWKMKRYTVLIQ
jgi:hypothetical protein